MCFSANVSFGSGIALSLLGLVCQRKTSTSAQVAFGSIPFVFAAQQISEGFVWLALRSPGETTLQSVPVYAFLGFSHIVWPVLIPLTILLLEKDPRRRSLLYPLLGLGIVLALYHLYCLLYLPLSTRIENNHIRYLMGHPDVLRLPGSIIYGMVTIVPAFVSGVKRMSWFGFFIIVSYVFTYLFYHFNILSVWCYFATLLSVIVYLILDRLQMFNRHRV